MSNLVQRIIAAIVGVGIILVGLFHHPVTYFLLFVTIQVLTQVEFYKLIKLNDNHPLRFFGTFCGLVLNFLIFGITANYFSVNYIYLILPLFSLIFFIKLYRPDPKPFKNIGYTFLGIFYVAVPFSMLHILAMQRQGAFSPELILGILLILWMSDSGAYFIGKAFGKHKLFESISPKKTWEGFGGGAIFAMGTSFILAQNTFILETWQWLVVGMLIVVAGTYGDLVESQFKRSIDIKDSSSWIPGHGGFLDRFDGLLLSVPFVVAFLMVIK